MPAKMPASNCAIRMSLTITPKTSEMTATVISKNAAKGNRKNVVIADCGIKSIATEHTAVAGIKTFPKVKDLPGAEILVHSEEHVLIQLD